MSLISPIGKRDHIQGNENALIELVEYGDYQCPYCRQAYHIIKKLQLDYGEQLKFIFRNFPLVNIHRFARLATTAGEVHD
ncbi:DsbA family protein [Flavobacterium sp. P21]|uniref:DsbA family protein n=1 Tax=Flavobacterium sp. P21 TaxID=3423948 RepID=UPI003D675BED